MLRCCVYLVLILLPALASCKGSSGGGGGDTQAPSVKTATPSDGTADVTVDLGSLIISALFDESVKSSTVNDQSFTVEGPVGPVSGTVGLESGTTATFQPDQAPALNTSYSATVSTDIEDLAGNNLASDFTWDFQTRDGIWQQARNAGFAMEGTRYLGEAAVCPDGGFILPGYQVNGGPWSIQVNIHNPETGWGTPVPLKSGIWKVPESIAVAAANHKWEAIVTWPEYVDEDDDGILGPGDYSDVWLAEYADGKWSAATQLNPDGPAHASSPDVVTLPDGRFFVYYRQTLGPGNNLWGSFGSPTSGWTTPEAIDIGSEDSTFSSHVIDVDPEGNFIMAWTQKTDTDDSGTIDPSDFSSVFARRYDAAAGSWGNVEQIDTEELGNAFSTRIASDAQGNFIVGWTQHDGSRNNSWAARYEKGSGWSVAERIETSNLELVNLNFLGMAADGSACAILLGSDIAMPAKVLAAFYDPQNGWQKEQILFEDAILSAPPRDFDMNSRGDAIIVGQMQVFPAGTRDVYFMALDSAVGTWTPPVIIDTEPTGDSQFQHVKMDESGNALMTWIQESTTRDLWGGRWTPGGGFLGAVSLESDTVRNVAIWFFDILMNDRGEGMAAFSLEDPADYPVQATFFK